MNLRDIKEDLNKCICVCVCVYIYTKFQQVIWWSLISRFKNFVEIQTSQSSPDILEEQNRKAYSIRTQHSILTIMLCNNNSIRMGKLEQQSRIEDLGIHWQINVHKIPELASKWVTPVLKIQVMWDLIFKCNLMLQSLPNKDTLSV